MECEAESRECFKMWKITAAYRGETAGGGDTGEKVGGMFLSRE